MEGTPRYPCRNQIEPVRNEMGLGDVVRAGLPAMPLGFRLNPLQDKIRDLLGPIFRLWILKKRLRCLKNRVESAEST